MAISRLAARNTRGDDPRGVPYVRRGIARPGSNGFRITRQSEWTECIIACADIVRPAAQLCSWVSAFFFSPPITFRFSSLSYAACSGICVIASGPSILRTARGKDDLECNKVRVTLSRSTHLNQGRIDDRIDIEPSRKTHRYLLHVSALIP